MSLRTDFKDDVLDTTQNTNRVFNIKDSKGNIVEGNVSLEDITEYTQEGDNYGANEVNEQNETINELLNPEFTSSDDATIFNSGNLGGQSAYAWSATDELESGDLHTTIFSKISLIFKNLRTIAKLIGTTNISNIGGGTITGAIYNLNTHKVSDSDARLADDRNPTEHSYPTDAYGKGTASYYGHVKLSNAFNSISDTGSGVAATPMAVKTAYDLAASKSNALLLKSGAVTKAVTNETAWTVTITQSGYTPIMFCYTNNMSGAIISNIESASLSNGRAEFTGFASSRDGVSRSTTFTVQVLWRKN